MHGAWHDRLMNLNLTRAQLEYAIDQYIVGYLHCGRDRDVLRRRLIDGATFDALAAEFYVSPTLAKTIVRRGVTTLLDRIAAAENEP